MLNDYSLLINKFANDWWLLMP